MATAIEAQRDKEMSNNKGRYAEYIRRPDTVFARELQDNEVIECYNGTKIGQAGDFVVVDSFSRVMIIRKDRFRKNFMGVS